MSPPCPTRSAVSRSPTRRRGTGSGSRSTTGEHVPAARISALIGLKKSLHDMMLKLAHERVLGVRLQDIDNGRSSSSSFHAALLYRPELLRRNEICAALMELESMGRRIPRRQGRSTTTTPSSRKNLGQRVRDHGYALTLSDDRNYTRYRVFKGHYDFGDIDGIRPHRPDHDAAGRRSSDHWLILVSAAIG